MYYTCSAYLQVQDNKQKLKNKKQIFAESSPTVSQIYWQIAYNFKSANLQISIQSMVISIQIQFIIYIYQFSDLSYSVNYW